MWYANLQLRVFPTARRFERLAEHYTFRSSVKVAVHGIPDARAWLPWTILRDDLTRLLDRPVELSDAGGIELIFDPDLDLPREGYMLRIGERGIRLTAGDRNGMLHAVYSLVQLVGVARVFEERGDALPGTLVVDWPHSAYRSWMVDMGRSIYTMDMLKRLVRIGSRLKLNTLHLHLHDSELNPVRYADLPLGSENPFAHELSDYADLIAYANEYGIAVVPELESWGHAGSILQHYPHLYGASRPSGEGHSFAMGDETLALLGAMYDQWLAIIPDGSTFCVGLDEGNWSLLPGADPAKYHEDNLPRLLHDLLTERAEAQGKQVRMLMWSDRFSNATIPKDLRPKIILAPWSYHLTEGRHNIERRVYYNAMQPNAYLPEGKADAPFICGMGQPTMCDGGAFAASRRWMELTRSAPNCLGGVVCTWGTNNYAGKLLGLWAGAETLWSPNAMNDWYGDSAYEEVSGDLLMRMRAWQSFTPDAEPQALLDDQGPEVLHGQYRWGARMGQRITPLWMPEKVQKGKVLVSPLTGG